MVKKNLLTRAWRIRRLWPNLLSRIWRIWRRKVAKRIIKSIVELPEVPRQLSKLYLKLAGEEANKVILEADAEEPNEVIAEEADEAIELGVEAVLVAGGEEANEVILVAVFRPREFFEPRPQQKSCVG